MRQYIDCQVRKKETKKIICNMCKKEIEVIDGMVKEEVLTVEKRWGYFSNKDNELHCFDLCEKCYDKLIESFAIPVNKE